MAGEFGTGIFPKGQFFSFSGGWGGGGGVGIMKRGQISSNVSIYLFNFSLSISLNLHFLNFDEQDTFSQMYFFSVIFFMQLSKGI